MYRACTPNYVWLFSFSNVSFQNSIINCGWITFFEFKKGEQFVCVVCCVWFVFRFGNVLIFVIHALTGHDVWDRGKTKINIYSIVFIKFRFLNAGFGCFFFLIWCLNHQCVIDYLFVYFAIVEYRIGFGLCSVYYYYWAKIERHNHFSVSTIELLLIYITNVDVDSLVNDPKKGKNLSKSHSIKSKFI